ncbi:hypothetical protein, partial [Streptomyces sp. MBT60]|uniref:hypothetical protein n=1 Tax=Streptomyces sp. MBT60 TaxID=2800409 RepID=UPI001F321DC5
MRPVCRPGDLHPPGRHTGRMTLVDLYAAHAATGKSPATLRTWIHRGELTRRGYDNRGRALVDLGEVEALIALKAQPVSA